MFDSLDLQGTHLTILGRTYSLTDCLRITAILGGYLLLRPYLLKLSAKFQAADHARDVDPTEESSHAAMTGKRFVGDEDYDSSSGEEGDGWGVRQRKQQREERRIAKELVERDTVESDEDIEEYLDKE